MLSITKKKIIRIAMFIVTIIILIITYKIIIGSNSIQWYVDNSGSTEIVDNNTVPLTCSKPCGGGIRTRSVTCDAGIDKCDNNNIPINEETCNEEVCGMLNYTFEEECSKMCNTGTQIATSNCIGGGGFCSPPQTIEKDCNTHACRECTNGTVNEINNTCICNTDYIGESCEFSKLQDGDRWELIAEHFYTRRDGPVTGVYTGPLTLNVSSRPPNEGGGIIAVSTEEKSDGIPWCTMIINNTYNNTCSILFQVYTTVYKTFLKENVPCVYSGSTVYLPNNLAIGEFIVQGQNTAGNQWYDWYWTFKRGDTLNNYL